MRTNQAEHPIRVMACVLGVSASGFYDWRDRQPSDRQRGDAALLRRIRTIHAVSHGTYGAPRVHAELRAEGVQIGRKRVARLMREAGIAGVSRRRRAVRAPERTSAGDPPASLRQAVLATGEAPSALCSNHASTSSSQPPSAKRCDNRLRPPSIRPGCSAIAAEWRASGHQPALPAMHSTTPCARASSPPSNAS